MTSKKPLYINIKGALYDLATPRVMGILNVTPDSFYAGSRKQTESDIAKRVEQIANENGDMIDIGAYSSRPGAAEVSTEEEMNRLRMGLAVVKEVAAHLPVSIDTFRADVARMCVEEYGADMINDISGGEMDANMFNTMASLNVPYIMMHMKGTPQDMQSHVNYQNLRVEVLQYFARKIEQLNSLGMNDVIVDPGFGFAKNLAQNYELMNHLDDLALLECPVLVGISRKSMIYKLLNTTADEALNGTTVLNTIALGKGANILRVHDVKACREAVEIFNMTQSV